MIERHKRLRLIALFPTFLIGNKKHFLITPINDQAQYYITDKRRDKPLTTPEVQQHGKNQRNDSYKHTESLPDLCISIDREHPPAIGAFSVIPEKTRVGKLPDTNFVAAMRTCCHRDITPICLS